MMNQSLIAWNVRGLGVPDKRARVKGILRRSCATIVALTETKWNVYSRQLIASVGGSRSAKWMAKDVVNSKGGIAIFWEEADFELLDTWEGKFSLAIRLKPAGVNDIFAVMVVYGPQKKDGKLAFINE
ncbi:unnamed protein product [Linum trigynum]|uniref:Uncharacterized protein n=1 Tax=Linum trigynum TaxID=586398 RepID=A0AAV2DT87_9ROSI